MGNIVKSAWRWLGRYGRDRRGNIAAVTALMIIPLVGAMGLAAESGGWFVTHRAEQNAADSGVLAMAQSYLYGGTTYLAEGQSAAGKLGFVNGSANTTVTPAINQPCPVSGSNCFKVTVSRNVALNFSKILGYRGNGSGMQTITASAMAMPKDFPVNDCITSRAPPGSDGFHVNGNGNTGLDFGGCTIQVNGDATCNGSNSSANALIYIISGTNKNSNCVPAISGPQVTDPYTSTYPRTNIPTVNPPVAATTCPNSTYSTCYWQSSNTYGRTGNGNNTTVSLSTNTQPTANIWNGTVNGNQVFYGDVTVTADTTINGNGPLTIVNGSLILNGHTLTGSSNTLIFTSASATNSPNGALTANSFNPGHSMPTDGTVDIAAPTDMTDTWHGVAVYMDPSMTTNVDWSSSGSNLTWDITGLIYMPNSNINFSGTINKASGGKNCFTMIDYTIQFSGTIKITEGQTECSAAGLIPPTSTLRRPVLVQ